MRLIFLLLLVLMMIIITGPGRVDDSVIAAGFHSGSQLTSLVAPLPHALEALDQQHAWQQPVAEELPNLCCRFVKGEPRGLHLQPPVISVCSLWYDSYQLRSWQKQPLADKQQLNNILQQNAGGVIPTRDRFVATV